MLAASPSAVSGSIFAVFVLAIRRQLLDLRDEIEDEGCLGTSLQGISGLVEARLGLGGCVPAYPLTRRRPLTIWSVQNTRIKSTRIANADLINTTLSTMPFNRTSNNIDLIQPT